MSLEKLKLPSTLDPGISATVLWHLRSLPSQTQYAIVFRVYTPYPWNPNYRSLFPFTRLETLVANRRQELRKSGHSARWAHPQGESTLSIPLGVREKQEIAEALLQIPPPLSRILGPPSHSGVKFSTTFAPSNQLAS